MRVSEGLLREKINRKELIIFGGIMDSRTSSIVEIYNDTGYDALFIDREHTSLNSETIADQIRVARCLGMPCMVRVAEDSYHELNRTLDQAPDGIYIPRIRSKEQVEIILKTVKYPPEGIRGLAASSCPVGKYQGWDSVVEQVETVNRNLVVGIQIETAEALKNLDNILSVKGVDIAVVGPDDLTINMGIAGQWEGEEYLSAVDEVIASCNRHGVLPGIAVGNPQKAIYWVKKGMKVIWYGADIYLLWSAAYHNITALREGL